MKLRDCRVFSDENIHADVVEFLRSAGIDVFDVREQLLIGATDRELLRIAFEQHRVILTHDSDFGMLAIRGGQSAYGIIYIRPGHINPVSTIATIQTMLNSDVNVEPPFIVVAKRTGDDVVIRLRSLQDSRDQTNEL